MKILAFSLCNLFLLCFSWGQQPAWEEVDIKENVQLEQCMVDTLGFLWGLSPQGLYKYDGFDFILALSPDPIDDKFLVLSESERQSIIIGTEGGRILIYDPYRNQLVFKSEISNLVPISKFSCKDPTNDCIIISYGNGLYWRWNAEDQWVSQDDQLLSNEVYDIVRRNEAVLISSDQGIQEVKRSGGRLVVQDFLFKDNLLDVITTNLVEDGQGLWVSYFADSLSYISPTKSIHYRFPEVGRIEEMKVYDGRLYIASENGLFELDGEKLIRKFPTVGRKDVKDFTFDQYGNLWLINGKSKLFRASLSFQSYDIQLTQIQAIQVIGGELWVGNKDGLFKIEDQKLHPILNNNITCLFYKHNYLWVGTFSNGFFILDEEGNVLKNISNWQQYEDQSVLSMLISDHDLYICSLTGVVKIHFDNKAGGIELGNIVSLNDLVGEGYFYQIMEDEKRIVLASDGKGILILENDSLTILRTFNDGSKIGSVYSMAKDREGKIWFSTASNGLGFVDQGVAYKREQERNNADHYSSIASLSDGKIIMIRSGSIDILDPENNQILYFEKEVGISDEPPFLNSIAVSRSKAIFSHNDLIYQFSSHLSLKSTPDIWINSVLANLDTLKANTRLKQEQNNIEFNYTGSWLSNPAKLTYQYQLEGFDDRWRTTKDRSVSFPKLEAGQYNFKIRASVDEDFESDREKSFSFSISRHFYNTWWFWMAMLALSSYLLIRWRDTKRKRHLAEIEIEKKHIETQLSNLKSQLNPHFLFNSFNTLMGLIEEDQVRSLSFVEKLTDFYRLVLEQGKNQLISIKEEMNLVNLFIDILNERFQHALVVNIPSFNKELLIPPLTLQLLIENAVKHNQIGGGKKLTIDLFVEDQYLIVKNNLSPKNFHGKSTGSGLSNIKKRYLLLNPKPIQIQKSDDYFIVKLPLIEVE